MIYAAAHLGYDPRQVPIGGGAQVALRLIRRWTETKPFPLIVLGSGPLPLSLDGLHYRTIPWHIPGGPQLLTDLGVRGYARFSRQFQRGVTEYLAARARECDPRQVCVLHNDIAEAGDLAAIARLGYLQVAIFHVDVVDYAARIYGRGLISAPRLAAWWRGLERTRLARLLPDVARLIFQKQEACARHCQLLVVPSPGMREVLLSAYPWRSEEDVLVLPWGAISEPPPPGTEEEAARIRGEYGLAGDVPVVLALSRISPEKGQDLLLRALRLWERRAGGELVAFICGAPAFIHGQGYMRCLMRLARQLRRARVHFPGYVAGARKAAFFRVADLYVFPSRHESYGLTLLEAMAAGLPVLTTPHRSAADLVRPECGRVVEASPQGIYQGLRELLGDREALARMGREARAFAQGLTFERAADRLAQAIGSLAGGPEGI